MSPIDGVVFLTRMLALVLFGFSSAGQSQLEFQMQPYVPLVATAEVGARVVPVGTEVALTVETNRIVEWGECPDLMYSTGPLAFRETQFPGQITRFERDDMGFTAVYRMDRPISLSLF